MTHEGPRRPPPDPNRFPTTQLFLLSLVRVAEPISLTAVFPYAWNLVTHFHVGDEHHAAFYAGLFIAAFAFAESLTGVYWGGLSDRLGRKPVLIMGCLGTVGSLVIVGFAVNFWMALFGRFIGGALNGNVGVVQTMVGELVVNPEHLSVAYAVMPFVWSVGTILGPCIGGYFATPCHNFPGFFADGGLFCRFPYLLPNLICAALMALSIVAAFCCLVETHPEKRPWNQQDEHAPQPYLGRFRRESTVMTTQSTDQLPAVNLRDESYGTFNDVVEDAIEEEWVVSLDGTCKASRVEDGGRQEVFTKRVIQLIAGLGIFTFHAMTFENLLPIFFQYKRVSRQNMRMASVTPEAIGSFAGGLGLSVKDVGVIMAFNGLVALFIQACVFPVATALLGVWKTFLVATTLFPLAYIVMPFLVFVPPAYLQPAIYAALFFRNCMSILAYPLLLIMIKEASPSPKCLGKINGLAAATGAACRTIASPIAGVFFGLGIELHFTPLAWWASALFALIGTAQALTIKRANTGPHHHVRSIAHLTSGAQGQGRLKTKASIVRIRVEEEDPRRHDGDGERMPLMRRQGG